jgi:hypothetical protein
MNIENVLKRTTLAIIAIYRISLEVWLVYIWCLDPSHSLLIRDDLQPTCNGELDTLRVNGEGYRAWSV